MNPTTAPSELIISNESLSQPRGLIMSKLVLYCCLIKYSSEVCTHDRGQDSPIQTDLARLIRCLLHGKEENFNPFNVTGLLSFCLQTEMS